MAHRHGCLAHDCFGTQPEAMGTRGKCLQQRRCIPPTVKSESWLCKLGGQHQYQTDSFLWCELPRTESDLAQPHEKCSTSQSKLPSWDSAPGLCAVLFHVNEPCARVGGIQNKRQIRKYPDDKGSIIKHYLLQRDLALNLGYRAHTARQCYFVFLSTRLACGFSQIKTIGAVGS